MAMPMPLPVEKTIQKLGRDLSYARRRRHMSQAMLAERIGTSERTVRTSKPEMSLSLYIT